MRENGKFSERVLFQSEELGSFERVAIARRREGQFMTVGLGMESVGVLKEKM